MAEIKVSIEMKDDGSSQKTASEVKQPITLEHIHEHLEGMEKSAEVESYRRLGVDFVALGLATVAIGVALRAWKLDLIGLLVAVIGLFVATWVASFIDRRLKKGK